MEKNNNYMVILITVFRVGLVYVSKNKRTNLIKFRNNFGGNGDVFISHAEQTCHWWS